MSKKIKMPDFIGGFNSLSDKQKFTTIGVFVALVLGVIVILRFRKLDFSSLNPFSPSLSEKQTTDSLEDAVSGATSGANKRNISKTEQELNQRYLNIFNAMNKWGTDSDVLIRNLEGLNKYDILYIKELFGIKLYSDGVLASNWVTEKFWSNPLDLNGWIREELSHWGDRNNLKKVEEIFESVGLVL